MTVIQSIIPVSEPVPVDGFCVTLNVAPPCSVPVLSRFSHDNVPSLLWKSISSGSPVPVVSSESGSVAVLVASSASSTPTDALRSASDTVSVLVVSASFAYPVGAAVSSIV